MLHNGFESPLKRREEFGKRVAEWDPLCFISAQSASKPWVWYMSDEFIARILAFIVEVIVAADIRLMPAAKRPAHPEGECGRRL